MFFDIIIYFYIVLMVFLIVVNLYQYMLVVLILLELIVLNIIILIFLSFRIINLEFYLIYYMVFILCERVLGLIMLILIVRYRGNEYYYFLDVFKF